MVERTLNLYRFCLTGRNWEAIFYYNKALRIKPTHMESLLGAARVFRAKGQYTRVHHIMHRLIMHTYTVCLMSYILYIAYVVLYVCETWSLTLRMECRLRVF